LKSRVVEAYSQQLIVKLSVRTEVEVSLSGRSQRRQINYILTNLWFMWEYFTVIGRLRTWCEGQTL